MANWIDVVGASTLEDGGYVGDLLDIALAHLGKSRDAGQLTDELAGEVYASTINAAMVQAITFALKKDTAIAQEALIARQTKGFDDDAKQKLLKQALDSWSVAYSVAKDSNSIPDAIKVNPIDSVMKNAMDSLGITVSNNPIGEI